MPNVKVQMEKSLGERKKELWARIIFFRQPLPGHEREKTQSWVKESLTAWIVEKICLSSEERVFSRRQARGWRLKAGISNVKVQNPNDKRQWVGWLYWFHWLNWLRMEISTVKWFGTRHGHGSRTRNIMSNVKWQITRVSGLCREVCHCSWAKFRYLGIRKRSSECECIFFRHPLLGNRSGCKPSSKLKIAQSLEWSKKYGWAAKSDFSGDLGSHHCKKSCWQT